MRVLVTGATGFLGGYVVRRLHDRGHEVVALVRSGQAQKRADELGAQSVHGDLDDQEETRAAFRSAGADALINVASLGFGHAPTIVGAAAHAGLQRAIFVSTTAIFTRLAAGSKSTRVDAEDCIQTSELAWTIIRPTMIYGDAGDRNIARLLRVLRRAPFLPVPGGGRRLQQPVHVADVACGVVAALEVPEAVGRTFDVAGPEPLTFRSLIREAASAAGRRPILVPVPLPAVIALVRVHTRVSSRPRITVEQLERLNEDKAFDITPAREVLGYHPRSFADGVREQAAQRR